MRWSLGWAGFAVFAGLLAYRVGDGYVKRMSRPEGYELVAVDDEVRGRAARPRRTVVVVADGLRADHARRMRATSRLAAQGQCLATDVGHPTVSRPVYAVLSTGLEQDRTGIRNNDEDQAIAAESIWAIARHAGMVVEARSELPWWKELFPDGFDRMQIMDRAAPHFVPLPAADLTLVHPVWIDEAGHDHGAAAPQYAAAVGRLDDELGAFLESVDFTRDLVVLTADHGHTARGGHGGRSPEVSTVLTCFAGRGVARRDGEGTMTSREIAPALAVLLGLRFPRHMRAGEDGLDVIWEIVDARHFDATYLADRRAAIARYRAANPVWSEIYAAGRSRQGLEVAALLAMIVALVGGVERRRGHGGAAALGLSAWLVATILLQVVVHVVALGSFDVSAINKRVLWVRTVSGECAAVAGVAFAVRWLWTRDLRRTVGDQALLVAIGVLVNLGLVWVFGDPLGFPAPTPPMYYLPFFASIVTMWSAAVLGIGAVAALGWRPTDG